MRREAPRLRSGSNLKAKRKRLVIVFATLFATKQGADRAEQAQAIGCDYATGESCRLAFLGKHIEKHPKVCYNTI